MIHRDNSYRKGRFAFPKDNWRETEILDIIVIGKILQENKQGLFFCGPLLVRVQSFSSQRYKKACCCGLKPSLKYALQFSHIRRPVVTVGTVTSAAPLGL